MKKTYLILTLLSGILLSVPFLVPHCGFIALFAFVPLLCMDRLASSEGTLKFWRWHYATFLLWNAFTTFWVCNATIGGGIFACVANALQMSLIFGLFRLSKRYFKGALPYIFLMFTWIAWERAYFSAEISWPWLTLGNAFARSIKSIQWYEYTGVLGGSLWVWLSNLSIFGTMVALSDGSWNRFNAKAKTALVSWLVILLACPFILSLTIWNNYEEKSNPLDVLILQPNIDPYHKFESLSQSQQNDILEEQIVRSLTDADTGRQILIVGPETFTSDIVINDFNQSNTWNRFTSLLERYPNAKMLLGAASMEFFNSAYPPSKLARQIRDGRWYETHNSALMMDYTGKTEVFHKSKLVVGVEKTPYPGIFCKIDDMLGGVIARNVGQERVSVLHVNDSTAIGSIICYESVYGEYCTEYVKKGAKALAIITNDSWWKDTPGYHQHLSYASLRAIETRRSIARSANTGISAVIDQRGEILEKTHWWKKEELLSSINLNSGKTAFVEYGDICGRVCTFAFLLLLLSGFVSALTKGKKR